MNGSCNASILPSPHHALARDAYYTKPVPWLKPDNAFGTTIVTLMVYAMVFLAFETIANLRPEFLPRKLTPKKKYEILFRFSRCLTWTIAALLALPSAGAMVDYIRNDDVVMVLPSRFVMRLLEFAMGFAVTPILFDLCARRDIHWTTLVHHLATCLCMIVNLDWNIGTSIGVYHCTTCFFVLPLDFALGLCAIEADSQTCAKWLVRAKYTGSCVFTFAQVGILRSLYKMYFAYAAVETYSKTSLAVGFSLALVLDLVLVATQSYLIHVLHGMATRKQAAVAKQL